MTELLFCLILFEKSAINVQHLKFCKDIKSKYGFGLSNDLDGSGHGSNHEYEFAHNSE